MLWNLPVFPYIMGYLDVCDIHLYTVDFADFLFWHTFWKSARRCRCGVFRSLSLLTAYSFIPVSYTHLTLPTHTPLSCLVIDRRFLPVFASFLCSEFRFVFAAFGCFLGFLSTPSNRADSAARNGRNTLFTPPCLRRHCRHSQNFSISVVSVWICYRR